jgi:hypothetical protein
VRLAAGSGTLCLYPGKEAAGVEIGACGSVLLGSIHASGDGYFQNQSDASPWIAGRLGLTLAVPLTRRWATRAGAEFWVPFRRYIPLVENVGPVYDPAPFGVSLTIGPELRFF